METTTTTTTIGSKDAFYASTKSNGETKTFGIDIPTEKIKAVLPILKGYLIKAGLKAVKDTENKPNGKIRVFFTGSDTKALRLALRRSKGKVEVPTFRGNTAKYYKESLVPEKA